MKKKQLWILTVLLMIAFLTAGCQKTMQPEGKIKDLECSVLDEDEMPQPLAEAVEENKGKEMKLSYEKDGELYIVRGYGEQKSGGYSITMKYCYLAEDGIHVAFELIGPPSGEKIPEESSCPYLVVKTDAAGQNIIFEQ